MISLQLHDTVIQLSEYAATKILTFLMSYDQQNYKIVLNFPSNSFSHIYQLVLADCKEHSISHKAANDVNECTVGY